MRRTKNRTAASGTRLHLFGGLVFTLVALSAWVLINVQNLQEFLDTYQKREQEREQIDVLKQRIKRLKRQQQSLAYNGIESEKQVRERMNLMQPGEHVLFLKNEEEPKAEQASATDGKAPISGEIQMPEEQAAATPDIPAQTAKTQPQAPGVKVKPRQKSAVVNKSDGL